MKFTKMQGAGNDFVIINNMEENQPQSLFGSLAKLLCERRMSIGADGFMVVDKALEGGDYRMYFYNTDGSMGEMCGNGARCIAKYGYEHGLGGEELNIETTAGLVKGWRLDKEQYKVRLNDITKMELDITLNALGQDYICSYVELGDPCIPHLVVEYPGLAETDPKELWALGSALRYHEYLPKGANVNFYEITGEDQVFERTFERGVEDFTYACGTGTGSMVSVLTTKGLVSGDHVEVSMAGGKLFIDAVKGDNSYCCAGADVNCSGGISDLYLSGPAVIVAEGEVGEDVLNKLK